MRLSLLNRPATEPLTLEEAKEHLRVDSTEEDALISALIIASREVVENYTGRVLGIATYKLTGDVLEASAELPKADFQQVLTVDYATAEGPVILDNTAYTVNRYTQPATVFVDLPSDMVSAHEGASITFTAGFDTVPESLKAAMKLLIGHLYANRESVVIGTASFASELPMASEYLMNPYRVYSF